MCSARSSVIYIKAKMTNLSKLYMYLTGLPIMLGINVVTENRKRINGSLRELKRVFKRRKPSVKDFVRVSVFLIPVKLAG